MGTRQPGPRLGTSRRAQLALAHGRKPNALATLWYAYSGHNGEDVVLQGQMEWANFLLVESTPKVLSVDYAPRPNILGGTAHAALASIVAYTFERASEWHVLHAAEPDQKQVLLADISKVPSKTLIRAAQDVGAIVVVRTKADFQAQALLLSNWARALSWIAAARCHGLSDMQEKACSTIRATGPMTLRDVQRDALDPHAFALAVAAMFRLVQQGRLACDLHLHPLSLNTKFSLSRETGDV